MKVDIVVVAAGSGSRFGQDKIFFELYGKPLVFYTLHNLFSSYHFEKKILVLNPRKISEGEKKLYPFFPDLVIVEGGNERTISVLNGVRESVSDYVLIHDGARPFVPSHVVENVVKALRDWYAVTPAEPVRDTVKYHEGEFVIRTLDRSSLKSIQTPQGFRRDIIRSALEDALHEGLIYTDETTLIEERGLKAKFVPGSPLNFKITYEEDVKMAERILSSNLRSGIGFDIHRFSKGRRMVLGGVDIPCEYGLAGHSDGDALTHAIIDALLGASGLGDIGELFPDSDERFRDIRSTILLERVVSLMEGRGFFPVNIDAVVITERPKILKYRDGIVKNLSRILRIPENRVSVKGKTAEKMGFVGRKEGLAVIANALVMEVKNANG